jgi:hypothetical protein
MTTVAKPSALHTAPTGAPSRRRAARRRPLMLVALAVTLAAAAAGTSLVLAGSAAPISTPAAAATPAPAWTPFGSPPFGSPWLESVGVRDLKRQLVRAGYQVKVDDRLDPVTKSALADYLLPGSESSLGPVLARALAGTVLIGRRNPAAWNRRFGLERLTKFVERPLTGPGGQLDANGNLRVP